MLNQAQLAKRPPRAATRLMKSRGDLRAGSLGDIAQSGTAGFARVKHCRDGHKFLVGAEILVCSKCGYSEPRTDIPQPAQTPRKKLTLADLAWENLPAAEKLEWLARKTNREALANARPLTKLQRLAREAAPAIAKIKDFYRL